jgi:DNA-binding MarR family transcriptional regulator
LAVEGEMSMTAFAQPLGVGLPTANQLVGDFAREAWDERREDEAERRRTFVALAPHERGAFLQGLRLFVDEMARDAPEKDKK